MVGRLDALAEDLHQSPVHEQHLTIVTDQDVGGLDVAVDHAPLVCIRQCFGHIVEGGYQVDHGQAICRLAPVFGCALCLQSWHEVGEGAALDDLHRVVGAAIGQPGRDRRPARRQGAAGPWPGPPRRSGPGGGGQGPALAHDLERHLVAARIPHPHTSPMPPLPRLSSTLYPPEGLVGGDRGAGRVGIRIERGGRSGEGIGVGQGAGTIERMRDRTGLEWFPVGGVQEIDGELGVGHAAVAGETVRMQGILPPSYALFVSVGRLLEKNPGFSGPTAPHPHGSSPKPMTGAKSLARDPHPSHRRWR